MDLKEVDVIVYCGQFKSDNDTICMPPDVPVDHCEMVRLAAGQCLSTLILVDFIITN